MLKSIEYDELERCVDRYRCTQHITRTWAAELATSGEATGLGEKENWRIIAADLPEKKYPYNEK